MSGGCICRMPINETSIDKGEDSPWNYTRARSIVSYTDCHKIYFATRRRARVCKRQTSFIRAYALRPMPTIKGKSEEAVCIHDL